MKGASVEVAIWSFFSRQGLYFHHTKNQPPLRPPSTFPEHWPSFLPYLFSENVLKLLWYKIWVMFWLKKMISFSLGVFLDWEISIYFCPLFVHFRTLGNTLTYSAMRRASLKMHVHELQTPVHNCLLTPASNVFGGEATNFIEADPEWSIYLWDLILSPKFYLQYRSE